MNCNKAFYFFIFKFFNLTQLRQPKCVNDKLSKAAIIPAILILASQLATFLALANII